MSDAVMVPRAEMKFAIAQAIWEIDRNESTAARTLMVAAQNLLTAASTPVGGWEEPVAWRFWHEGGWNYSATDPSPHLADCVEREPLYAAPPPPSVSIGNGSRPQEAVPSEQAALPVLALLDQISALCTAFNDQIHDAEDTLGQINQLAYAGIAALRPDTVRKGIGDLAVIDLQTIRMWLEGLADCTDMNEVCADGGVTVGMAYQQDAREFSARIARMLPTTPQPADGCSSNEGAG